MDLEDFKKLHARFSKLSLDNKDWDSEKYDDYVNALNDSKDCSDWCLKQELDKKRFDYSYLCCLKLAKHISDGIDDYNEIIYDNLDLILRQSENGTVGIPIHDGGTSMIEIKYCPFCGTQLKLNNKKI